MTTATLEKLSEAAKLAFLINSETEYFALFLFSKKVIQIKIGESDYYYLPSSFWFDFDVEECSTDELFKQLKSFKRIALKILKEQNPTSYEWFSPEFKTKK